MQLGYKSYQYDDFVVASNQNRFLFAYHFGLGKSWELTALYVHLKAKNKVNKAIVCSSDIGLFNLKSEITKFSYENPERILVINSIKQLKDRDLFNSEKYDYDIIILGYDTFRRIFDFYKKNKKKINDVFNVWLEGKEGIIFLDECHLLGNPKSQRCQAFLNSIGNFNYRYLFSGSLADKYEKLYAPARILDKALTRDLPYMEWLKQYVDLGTKFSKYAINHKTWKLDKLEDLNKSLLKYSIKRGIECLDVPDQYFVPTITIPMEEKHRQLYEDMSLYMVKCIKEIAEDDPKQVNKLLINSFQLTHLICENPVLLIDNPKFPDFPEDLRNKIEKFDFKKSFAKLQVLDSVISTHCDEEDEKILVWYYHPKTLDEITKHLGKRKFHVCSSELSKEERLQVMNDFKKSKDSKIAVMSVVAASSSITVTEAKAMVFFETSWNYVDYSQATGRIQRPGQDKTTKIYTIRYSNSLDCLQQNNLDSKGTVVDVLLSKKAIRNYDWRNIFNSDIGTQY